jgi:hypothetical protein
MTRSPIWGLLATIYTAATVYALCGGLQAHGLYRAAWLMLLVGGSLTLWIIWWEDRR